MKLKIKCQKCGSTSVSIVADEGESAPMYKCDKCGHKGTLFPK